MEYSLREKNQYLPITKQVDRALTIIFRTLALLLIGVYG